MRRFPISFGRRGERRSATRRRRRPVSFRHDVRADGCGCLRRSVRRRARASRRRMAASTPWPFYDPIDNADASTLRAVVAKDIFPQGYISQVQAAAMCANSGKRLCTLAEWTAACRGEPDHDYVYPYGDTYDPTACNEGRESPIIRLYGPNPSYANAELNDPEDDQLDAGLARGGSFPKCVSTYGAFDMHGNLHEWVRRRELHRRLLRRREDQRPRLRIPHDRAREDLSRLLDRLSLLPRPPVNDDPVAKEGLEPSRVLARRILNPLRLPFRHFAVVRAIQ